MATYTFEVEGRNLSKMREKAEDKITALLDGVVTDAIITEFTIRDHVVQTVEERVVMFSADVTVTVATT